MNIIGKGINKTDLIKVSKEFTKMYHHFMEFSSKFFHLVCHKFLRSPFLRLCCHSFQPELTQFHAFFTINFDKVQFTNLIYFAKNVSTSQLKILNYLLHFCASKSFLSFFFVTKISRQQSATLMSMMHSHVHFGS